MYSVTSVIVVGDDHVLPAQHVGGTQQHRIAQLLRAAASASSAVMTVVPSGRGMPQPLQQLVEPFPVLRRVDAVGRRAQDVHPAFLPGVWSA